MFFMVFLYSACLSKWLQNASQIDPEAAKLIPKWPSWRSCWPILALLTTILAPNSSNLGSKRPQDGAWNAFFSTFLWRSPFPWPILVAICDQIGPNLGSSSPKFHQTASINTPRAHNIPPDRDFLISDSSKLNFHDFNKHSDQQGLHS